MTPSAASIPAREPGRRPWRALRHGLVLCVAMLVAGGVRAETSVSGASARATRMSPGTVLELSAVGVPAFRFRITVDGDGTAAFPLLGTWRVDTLSAADLLARLQAELPRKAFRDRSVDGKDRYLTLGPDEIVLSVVEYRPVYVGGDVAKPGAVPFRPGLSAWEALALAGGFTTGFTGGDVPLIAADLKGQIEAELIELQRAKAHAVALQAQLDGTPDVEIRQALKAPLPSAVLDRLAETEHASLVASLGDWTKEVAHLKEQAAKVEAQVATLKEQQRAQEEAMGQQKQYLDRLRDLNKKGAAPISQINVEERQYGYVEERFYQVGAQLMQAELTAGETRRKLDLSADQRRIRLLAELQDTQARIDTGAARLDAANDKLSRALRLQGLPETSDAAELTLHRASPEGPVTRPLDPRESLEPGDDLAVRLPRPTLSPD